MRLTARGVPVDAVFRDSLGEREGRIFDTLLNPNAYALLAAAGLMPDEASVEDAQRRLRTLRENAQEHRREIERLEFRVRESAEELRALRERWRARARAEVRAEIEEIRGGWEDVDHKWWVGVLAGLVLFVLASYAFYANLGWYADQRALPVSSDWLLDHLPRVNLVPLLSWGWLALHGWALGIAVLYHPRRMPFLLFLLGLYLCVRTLFVFLSPIGAPVTILDMRELDTLFAAVAGEYTFQNEFVFSGHTAVPFLFFLFFDTGHHGEHAELRVVEIA